jgi:hypothetical protein
MDRSQTRSLAWSVPQVFDAALTAASQLGYAVSQADSATGHLYLSQSRRLGRPPRPFAVSVTDSGLGSTVVLISWRPSNRVPWPLRSEGRTATRLCRRVEANLGPWRPPFAG